MLFDLDDLIDNVQGPAFDFVVDTGDVLAENSDRRKLYAAEKEHADGDRRESLGDVDRQQPQNQQNDSVGAEQSRHQKPESGRDLKRPAAEAENGVQPVAKQAGERLFLSPCRTIGTIEEDFRGGKSDVPPEAGQESASLPHPVQRVDHLAVQQRKDPGV